MWFGSVLLHVEAASPGLSHRLLVCSTFNRLALFQVPSWAAGDCWEVSQEQKAKAEESFTRREEGGWGSGTCNGATCSLGRVGPRTSNGQLVTCPWTSGAPYRSRECRHLGSVWSFRPLVEACEREWIPTLGAHSY